MAIHGRRVAAVGAPPGDWPVHPVGSACAKQHLKSYPDTFRYTITNLFFVNRWAIATSAIYSLAAARPLLRNSIQKWEPPVEFSPCILTSRANRGGGAHGRPRAHAFLTREAMT